MHTTNYVNTLIEVSEDCPVETGQVPKSPGTVAALQYAFIAEEPYRHTSDEVLVAVAAARQQRPESAWPEVRAELFAKPQACLRSSPLVKTHGWGIHHDDKARVALVARGSAEYARLQSDPMVVKIRGMRSKKA